MSSLKFTPGVKSAEELELERTLSDLVARYNAARPGSAERRMITRQIAGVGRSELGRLLVEEVDNGDYLYW